MLSSRIVVACLAVLLPSCLPEVEPACGDNGTFMYRGACFCPPGMKVKDSKTFGCEPAGVDSSTPEAGLSADAGAVTDAAVPADASTVAAETSIDAGL